MFTFISSMQSKQSNVRNNNPFFVNFGDPYTEDKEVYTAEHLDFLLQLMHINREMKSISMLERDAKDPNMNVHIAKILNKNACFVTEFMSKWQAIEIDNINSTINSYVLYSLRDMAYYFIQFYRIQIPQEELVKVFEKDSGGFKHNLVGLGRNDLWKDGQEEKTQLRWTLNLLRRILEQKKCSKHFAIQFKLILELFTSFETFIALDFLW